MSRPSNQMRPLEGLISPEISRKNVVLPAPLGPMIERNSPRRTLTLTRSTARRLPNARVSCSVRSRASSGMAKKVCHRHPALQGLPTRPTRLRHLLGIELRLVDEAQVCGLLERDLMLEARAGMPGDLGSIARRRDRQDPAEWLGGGFELAARDELASMERLIHDGVPKIARLQPRRQHLRNARHRCKPAPSMHGRGAGAMS